VIVSRPSRIAGAPAYVVVARAVAGKAAGQEAFKIRLPPTLDGELYTVTVVPDDGTISPAQPGQPLPNALAPPVVLNPFALTEDRTRDITLDSGGLKEISGRVVDAVGGGVQGMVVKAWNRRGSDYELVSSTAITAEDGAFTLYVPLSRSTIVDLYVTPGPGQHRPSLVRRGVLVSGAPTALTGTVQDLRFPPLPSTGVYQLEVKGPSAAGGTRLAVGATVRLSTAITAAGDDVRYETEATVGPTGVAELHLIPGVLDANREYQATIVPEANAEQGAKWDATISVGPGLGGSLAAVTVPARAQLTGTVLDSENRAVAGLTVRPALSKAFLAAAAPATRALVDRVALPEVTTSNTGSFTMYLDPTVGSEIARYDLELLPPNASNLPRWSRDDVSMVDQKVEVGIIKLPAGTLVSGTVKTEDGVPVADALVQVYERIAGTARLRAIATSNAQGNMSLVLPAGAPPQ
jgi:hypothetical protein